MRPLLLPLLALSAGSLAAQEPCPAGPWSLERTVKLETDRWVTSLDVDPTGRIYVVQSLVPAVGVFAPDGRAERTVGSLAIGGVRLGWKGDTLWVTDTSGVRLLMRDGREAANLTWRVPMADEGSSFLPGPLLADGSLLGTRAISGGPWYQRDDFPLLRFSRAGAILDTIAMVQRPPARRFVDLSRDGRAARAMYPLAVSWSVNVSSLPVVATRDGTAVLFIRESGAARPVSFDLLRVSITGDTLLARSIAYEPKPITDEDANRIREMFAASRAGDYRPSSNPVGAAESLRHAARESLSLPEYYPPVRDIVAGQDGTIWLLREQDLGGVDRWEVYDAEGRLDGWVDVRAAARRDPLEQRFYLRWATRSELWAMTFQDDVPVTHRYAVRNSCGSGVE